MDPLEIELKQALQAGNPARAADAGTLTRRITKEYRRKQKAAGRLLAGYLLLLVVALIVLFREFFRTEDLKLSLFLAICILIVFEGTVLMKLWFWVLHGKIAIVRELKLLQLMLAERLPQPPGVPLGKEAEEEAVEPSSGSKRWWPFLAIVWAAALAGLVFVAWPRQEPVPKGAELYYEKALQPGSEGEIVDTFRVERSKACFHPVILPERGHAETWIAVGPESGPVWYEGPLNDFSRFWFGRGVAVGSYRIRIGPVSAETACRLRMFGVDSPQTGISDPRTWWLMICSALALGLPLVWLQNRLLRGLDPELAG